MRTDVKILDKRRMPRSKFCLNMRVDRRTLLVLGSFKLKFKQHKLTDR